ncbi:MAG: polysaccharide biosynthesis protein, partial [Clostridia bacterium]|nr:polysaccharide biosynthesis protein [Clostridia bacterium]
SVYGNVWRYANSRAYLIMVVSDTVGCAIGTAICYATTYYLGIWQTATIVCAFSLFTLVLRFCYQLHYRYYNVDIDKAHRIGVAIIGAGSLGAMLAEELLYSSNSRYRPVCFVDTNPVKIGSKICGAPVFGENEKTLENLKHMPVQEIIVALSGLDSDTMKKIIEFYRPTGLPVKLYDYPFKATENHDSGAKRSLREVQIEDLLFRDALKIVTKEANEYYRDKVIMVTGGGGSIGSELCRQIAKRHPKKLIIIDIYENNAYDIQQELCRKYGSELDLSVEIASVRDRRRMKDIFEEYRPEIVFHAAAHKHVPLMEKSSVEAVKNNILGTYNTANCAEAYGAEKFILISTDKAVNPTNIMGASKRMCERICQCRTDSKTSFAAVRFGNVLGSNGSVIPLFRRQIENGGPVTVTDKRIIRYFMTIPEASQLVMQAGAMANSGDLFVLDMGKPVKILELAENMIRLSGLVPYQDIDIVEVGLRPGEKLYEELLIKTENLSKTENNLIFIEHDTPATREEIEGHIKRIISMCKGEHLPKANEVKALLKELIPTYHDPEEVNKTASESEEMKAVK